MKKLLFSVVALAVFFVSCTESFKKGEGGLYYKVISDGKGKKIVYGNFFEISYTQTYKGKSKDSLLANSSEYGNQIAVLDSVQIPAQFFNIFKNVRVGDSIAIKQLTDSLMKNPGFPGFFRKGDAILSGYKIINIFATKEQADSAFKINAAIAKEAGFKKTNERVKSDLIKNEAQVKIDDKIINDYLTAHNITATKTEWGTYIALTAPGEGEAINKNSVAIVNYTGKDLKTDSAFDSNTDPKFNRVQPFPVDISEFRVIPGWIDALMHMKKGSKGKIFIPSTLGYGVKGSTPKIVSNENLVFDIEVTDVMTKEAYEAKQMAEQQKQMMEEAAKHPQQSGGGNEEAPSQEAPKQESAPKH